MQEEPPLGPRAQPAELFAAPRTLSPAPTALATADPTGHCLRPAFTARIAKELDRGGAAINLVAKPGQGAGRLLEDIKGLPANGPRLVSNLKKHRRIQTGLVADLWHQSGLDGESPADFGALCLRLEKDAPSTALLLHRFDSLFGERELDPAYNDAFVGALNALRNRGLSLICVSAEPLSRYVLLSGDADLPGSLLDLTRKDLPLLLHAEITAEIGRQDLPLDVPETRAFAGFIMSEARPLEVLDYCAERLRDGVDGELPLPQRLKRWRHRLDWERWWPSVRMLTQLRDRAAIGWRALGLPPPGEVLKSLKDLLPWLGGKMG
jgi:hypothetical protein